MIKCSRRLNSTIRTKQSFWIKFIIFQKLFSVIEELPIIFIFCSSCLLNIIFPS